MITIDAGVDADWPVTAPEGSTLTATLTGPTPIDLPVDGHTVLFPADLTSGWQPQTAELSVYATTDAGTRLLATETVRVITDTMAARAREAAEHAIVLRGDLAAMAQTMAGTLGSPDDPPGHESLHAIANTPPVDMALDLPRYISAMADAAIELAEAAIRIAQLASREP